MELRGTAALVTGGGRRIGRALALALAEEGVAVAVHYRHSADEAAEVVARIRDAGGRAIALAADLRDDGAVSQLVDAAADALGPIQILINNASSFEASSVESTDLALLRAELDVHLNAPYELTRTLVAQLPDGAQGRVINLLDWRALTPDPRYLAYSVSKGALETLTRTLARALGPRVTVNGIAPGAVLPPVDGSGKGSGDYLHGLPLERVGEARDVVRACLYLLRDADYTTGAVLPVDGGRHLL